MYAAVTPTHFNTTYARPRACKGCAIDQSLARIFLQGPCSRTPWFLVRYSRSSLGYALRTPVTKLSLSLSSPSLLSSLFHATPFSCLLPCACMRIFFSFLPLPRLLFPVIRYTFYTYGRRGSSSYGESLIGKPGSREVLVADVPRRQ